MADKWTAYVTRSEDSDFELSVHGPGVIVCFFEDADGWHWSFASREDAEITGVLECGDFPADDECVS